MDWYGLLVGCYHLAIEWMVLSCKHDMGVFECVCLDHLKLIVPAAAVAGNWAIISEHYNRSTGMGVSEIG